jgi:hypothetical protein
MPFISGGKFIEGGYSRPYVNAGAPTAGTNEVQTLTIGGTPTGGTFKLTYDGFTTTAITWSATNATLLANINAALDHLRRQQRGESGEHDHGGDECHDRHVAHGRGRGDDAGGGCHRSRRADGCADGGYHQWHRVYQHWDGASPNLDQSRHPGLDMPPGDVMQHSLDRSLCHTVLGVRGSGESGQLWRTLPE